MAFPALIPLVTGGLSLISRKYAVKIAKDKIRKSTKTGIEKAREYGKMSGQQFKRFDIDPVTGNAVAKFHKPLITGFDKGFLTGTGLTAVTLSGNKSTTQKPMSKKDKAILKYNKKMQETHNKYGIK